MLSHRAALFTHSIGNFCVSAPISDYGKIYTSFAEYSVAHPANAEEVCAIIRDAGARGTGIRVRGSGHTFSGATLPAGGEILLRTDTLDRYRFATLGTITVGAGAIAWDVRDFVTQFGLRMPVYNGGWAGPTVGGFVSAGGMGLRVPDEDRETRRSISEVFGGFWEHVAAVTLVDGRGDLHRFVASDPEFPWLFGSYGQLGVIVDVTLKLISDGTGREYPLGGEGRIPRVQTEDPAVNDPPPSEAGERLLYWFSYLVPVAQEDAAWTELERWVHRHAGFLRPQGGWVGPIVGGEPVGYRYLVRFRTFNPPLLYSRSEDFVLMGLMATFDGVGTARTDERLLALEHEFVSTALRHGYHLYPQAENIGRGLDYASYYGAETFARFEALKRRFDPDGIINRGVVFPAAIEPPQRSSAGHAAAMMFGRMFGSAS
jgi:FAD/FMN-containing dehydrogenase